jgi:hypothetical protein
VLSPQSLVVSLKKNTRALSKSAESIYYEFTLRNCSDEPLKGMKIEYRYFIELSSNRVELNNPKRVISGKLRVKLLDAGRTQKLRTKPVRDFEEVPNNGDNKFYDSETGNEYKIINNSAGRCRVTGIWIRIHGPAVDGKPTYRDFSDPEDLVSTQAWSEERIPLEEDFSFYDPVKPDKGIMPLDEVRNRGRAETSKEYHQWMRLVYDQFLLELSRKEVRELIDGVRFFYDSEYDSKGGGAALIGRKCMERKWFEDAVYWYEMSIAGGCKASRHGAHKQLIRLYASYEDASFRNGPKSVEYAELLLEEDKDNPWVLDLLARAYAANGQFNLAVKTQKFAIERFERAVGRGRSEYAEFRQRLVLYGNGELYLETDEDLTEG